MCTGQARDRGISIRISTAMAKPRRTSAGSTWFGNHDLVRLMMRFIEAENVGYGSVGVLEQYPPTGT